MTPVRDWEERRFGEYCRQFKTLNVKDEPGLEPLSVTKDSGIVLQSQKFKKRIATDLRRYKVIRRGQFAYDPMSLYYGAIGRLDRVDVGVVSPAYITFTLDSSVDPEWFRQVIHSPIALRKFIANTQGGNFKGKRKKTDWESFSKIKFPTPPLDEQRKIADILASVDESIRTTEAVIEQTRLLRNVVGESLFASLSESSPTTELLRLVSKPIRNGYSPVCSDKPTGRWILGLGAITEDGLDDRAVKPVPLDNILANDYQISTGDFLVSRSNTPERVGMAVLFRGEVASCSYPDLMMRFRVDGAGIDPGFLEWYLKSNQVRSYFKRTASGTSRSMVKITKDILGRLPVPLPLLDEQIEISRILAQHQRALEVSINLVESLNKTREGLLQDLLTGKVRVKP